MKTLLQKSLTRVLLPMLLLNFISGTNGFAAPLTGTYYIPTGYGSPNFATVAAAITSLNSNGVGTGGVTFKIQPGYTETFTSPTSGQISATGTAANPIVFINGGTPGTNDPLITGGPGTSNFDGIFVLKGASYITFNGIDIQDNNASNTSETLQMEWGYALLRSSVTLGSNNDIIENCKITLQMPFGGSSAIRTIGIFNGNLSTTGTQIGTTGAPITALTGVNYNNQFFGNTISYVSIGILETGAALATNATVQTGTITSATGTATVTGSGTSFLTVIAPGQAVYSGTTYIGNVLSIQSNTSLTLDAKAKATVSSAAFAIKFVDVNNQIGEIGQAANTISNYGDNFNNYGIWVEGATTLTNGISFVQNNVNINNNTIIAGTVIAGTATPLTIAAYGVTLNLQSNYPAGVTANIGGNSISMASQATAANLFGIWYALGNSTTTNTSNTINIYGNTVGISSFTTKGAYAYVAIDDWGSLPSNGTVQPSLYCNVYNNVLSGTSGSSAYPAGGTSYSFGFYSAGASAIVGSVENIYGNTVSNLNETNMHYTACYGIVASDNFTTKNVYNNVVHDITAYGTQTNGAYANDNVCGIYSGYSGYVAGTDFANIYSNKVYNISGLGDTTQVAGMAINDGNAGNNSTISVYDNIIGNITAINSTEAPAPPGLFFTVNGPPSVIGLQFGLINSNNTRSGTADLAYYNTIYLNQANPVIGSAAIYLSTYSSGSSGFDLRNNIVINNSSPTGSGYATALYFGNGATPYPPAAGYNTPGKIKNVSNNNLYYYGSPSANNLFYLDMFGTSYPTLASYQSTYTFSGGAGGESASFQGSATNPTFLSTTGSSPNFLFPDPSVAQSTESGAQNISGYISAFNCTGCRTGYPLGGQVNGGGTAPDIGAVESDVTYLPPPPTISVNTPSAICAGGSGAALTASCSANCGGISYTWAPSLGLSATVGASVTANPSSTTTYTVTASNSGGSTSSATSVVTVNPLPTLYTVSGSSPCGAVTVDQSGSTNGVSYQLYLNGTITGSPVSGTGNAINFGSQSNAGTYTVVGTGVGGCTANMNGSATVSPTPVGGTVTTPYVIICSGNTTTLTVTGSVGSNLQWQISSDNTTWSDISGATNTTYTTDPGDGVANKFYRMLSKSTACWNVSSTTAEVDISNPTITVTATNITDNSLTLNWSPTGSGNYLISYSGATSGTQTSVTPAKTITGLTSDGTYSITVTQTGVAGCSASGTITAVTTLCAMPTGVTLSSPAPAQIQVSWTGVGGADYRVYYRPLFSYNTYFTKDVSNASSVLLTKQGGNNLYASTTYEVYVSRLDCPLTGDVGQPTSPTNITTLPTVTCATPVIDSVRSLCPVQIEVFIHDNGVNLYNVFIQRLTPSILAVNSYGVSGTYFTINTPYSGDQYLIAIEAKCGSALSSLYVYPGNVTVKPLCSGPTNLVLSNPTCHGFTASWNADQCLSNSASQYAIYVRVAGTINYNEYGVPLPGNGIGPNKLMNFLTSGRTYQVFVRSVYNCNGFVTYGPASQVQTIGTLSSGCRDEDTEQPQENKPATQQYSPDNSEVFTLYPNPNTGKFIVDLGRLNMEEDAVRIEVFNMLGQTVMTQLTTISGGQMSEYINMPGGIAAGTYIVRLTAGKNVYTAKINVSK